MEDSGKGGRVKPRDGVQEVEEGRWTGTGSAMVRHRVIVRRASFRRPPTSALARRALQRHAPQVVVVAGDQLVERCACVGRAGVEELQLRRDPFLLLAAHDLEGAARALHPIGGRSDGASGNGGRLPAGGDVEGDPLLECALLQREALGVERRLLHARRVLSAVEQVPADSDREGGEVARAVETVLLSLHPVVERDRDAGEEVSLGQSLLGLRGSAQVVELGVPLPVSQRPDDGGSRVAGARRSRGANRGRARPPSRAGDRGGG